MAEQNQPPNEENLQAPEKLVEALNRLHKERIFVPPTVDLAVLRGARGHLRRLERPQSRWKPRLSWAAMAACLALAVWVGERFSNSNRARPFAREDINRDGSVDVLDAFALARQIETGGTLDPHWDINGDGRVDHADVNAIATRAVSLAQVGPEPRRSADLSPRQTGAMEVRRTEVRAPLVAVPLRSAASQNCTLPTVGMRARVGPRPRSADCKSAIQQIENQSCSARKTPAAFCLSLPARNERGESRREGKLIKSASSLRPSPPFLRRRGRENAVTRSNQIFCRTQLIENR